MVNWFQFGYKFVIFKIIIIFRLLNKKYLLKLFKNYKGIIIIDVFNFNLRKKLIYFLLLLVDYNIEEKIGNDVEWQNMDGVCQNKGGGGV